MPEARSPSPRGGGRTQIGIGGRTHFGFGGRPHFGNPGRTHFVLAGRSTSESAARSGELVLPMGDTPLLVPLVTAEPPKSDGSEASIVVEICEARVHVNGRPGVLALTDVFAALRKVHAC